MNKIIKKEDINEFDTIDLKIMFLLINNKEPLRFTDICEQTELTNNTLPYHLKKLKEKNLILETTDGYTCQPFWHNIYAMDGINNYMESIINRMLEHLSTTAKTQKDLSNAIQENLHMLIHVFRIDMQDD